MDSIAICAIFRNEAPYLLEWIGYHRMIGVDHFVLYDNASTDGGAALLRASPFARHVTLIDWPMVAGQLPAYGDFIARHASRFTWAAFIDIDEYLHPLQAETIRPLLARYDGFSGVLMHWLLFGPSGHAVRPLGLTIQNYLFRTPHNSHVKSLLRTRDLLGTHSTPHVLRTSGPVCNARGEEVPAYARQDLPPCNDVLVVNHYMTRSAAEWHAKIARGRATLGVSQGGGYPPERLQQLAAEAQVEDRRITRFVPRLRWVLRDAPAAEG